MQIFKESTARPGNIIEEREIPSDKALVPPLVVRLTKRLLEARCIEKSGQRKVELCLDEAITNAVVHGNGGDFKKKVKVILFRDKDSWGVIVSDEGQGFTAEALPRVEGEQALWQEHGRGIAIISLYLNELVYYDGGRTLFMRQLKKNLVESE